MRRTETFPILLIACCLLCLCLIPARCVQAQAMEWAQLHPSGSPPSPREGATCLYDEINNRMIVVGGQDDQRIYMEAYSLDLTPGEETWEQMVILGTPPQARSFASVVLDSVDRRVIISGGVNEANYLNDTWAFDIDGAERQWEIITTTGVPPARSHCMAAFDPARNNLLIFGGRTGALVEINQTWGLNLGQTPAAWNPVNFTGSVPGARDNFSEAFDAGESNMYIFGGLYHQGVQTHFFTDAWIMSIDDLPAWTELANCTGDIPVGRTGHMTVYDPLRGQLIVFGGWSGLPSSPQYHSDLYRLDVTTKAWEQGAPGGTAPAARGYPGWILDPSNRRVIVFGGKSAGPYLNDIHILRLDFNCKRNGVILTGPGPGAGNPSNVRGFITGFSPVPPRTRVLDFEAYPKLDETYGVNIAAGDVNRDGMAEIVTAPGCGEESPALVRIFSIRDLYQDVSKAARPSAGVCRADLMHPGFISSRSNSAYGLKVACGDVDGKPGDEIITASGHGPGLTPHIRVYKVDEAGDITPLTSFYAYSTENWGGNVACGDLDGDGDDEIITGPGPGPTYGSVVRGWDYEEGNPPEIMPINEVFFFASSWKMGVNVAAGDVDADGFAEMITGPGPGMSLPAQVQCWNYDNQQVDPLGDPITAYAGQFYGAQVSGGDIDGDNDSEIVTGPGAGAINTTHVKAWDWDGVSFTEITQYSFYAYQSEAYGYGVNVFALDEALIASGSGSRARPGLESTKQQ